MRLSSPSAECRDDICNESSETTSVGKGS
jgi:hypothetical protein